LARRDSSPARWLTKNGDADERKGAKNAKWEMRGVVVRCSQVQDDAPYFEPWRPEVHQQTEVPPGRAQVVQALSTVCAVERPHGFQFDKDDLLY
jgi:hypothetical protein